MKKTVLSLIMGAMLATSVVGASAATITTKDTTNGSTVVSSTSQTIFRPQTENPSGW